MRPAPTPPPSQRPSGVPASAGSDMSHPGTGYLGHTSAHAVPASSGGLNGGALGAPRLSHPPAPEVPGVRPLDPAFFGDALDAAMALVHADSGELATLDDSRQRLVLRAPAHAGADGRRAGRVRGAGSGQATDAGFADESGAERAHLW